MTRTPGHEGARGNFGFRVCFGPLSQQAAQMLWGAGHTGTEVPAGPPPPQHGTSPPNPHNQEREKEASRLWQQATPR